MWHAEQLLQPNQDLQKVERDAADVVQIEAIFEPSIAYCVWYNFRQFKVHMHDEEALVVMWDCALRAFCQLQFTNAQLSAMLAASPQASPAKNLNSEPLLLLQHNLSLSATALDRSRSGSRAHQSVSGTSSEAITFLSGSLGNTKGPEDARRRSMLQFVQAMTTPQAVSHVLLVRSALVLLHLLRLVKLITPGIGAVEDALWRTVDAMGQQMEACKHALAEPAAHSADQNATAQTAEEEELALKLAGLLMPTLRSSVKGSGRRAVMCCKMLVGLMPSSKPSLLCKVSAELLKLDIIIPLAAAFDRNRELSREACAVLACLVDRAALPSTQVDRTLDLLASVRGVQRCSNMLCPVFDYSQEQHDPSVSIAAQAYKIEWIMDSGCSLAPFGFMACVAKLLDNMLKRKPLWRQTYEKTSHAKTPCYKGAPGDQYAFLLAEPIWPTPGTTAWQDIQEVGMRVVATLEWLNGSHQLEYARNPTHVQLNKMLVLLLNNLVAGHLLDPQLDTQKLYDMMAPPLLTNKTPLGRLKFPPLSSLQAVVLRKGQGMASNMGAGNAHTVAQALSGIGLQDCTNVPRTGHMALSSKLNPKANTFKPRSQGVLVRNQV